MTIEFYLNLSFEGTVWFGGIIKEKKKLLWGGVGGTGEGAGGLFLPPFPSGREGGNNAQTNFGFPPKFCCCYKLNSWKLSQQLVLSTIYTSTL